MIHTSDREFIEGYKVYFDQAKLGFIHGMQPATMQGFENIYRTYLDKNFALTVWCSACVVDMMQRLARWWEEKQEQELLATQAGMNNVVAIAEEAFPVVLDSIKPQTPSEDRWMYVDPPKKRGRPRRV